MITFKNRNILDRLFILLLLIFFFFDDHSKAINPTNIEELSYYENQTLYIIVPKKVCKYISPMTIYFHSEFSDFKTSDDYEIRKINLKDKNYFVTYYLNDYRNYPQFVPLLKDNGLIRSKNIMGDNNLFFGHIKSIPSNKNISNGAILNNYQKVGGYLRGRNFFLKNSFYRYFKNKKNIFYNDFDFMPETYIYPEDKDLIETKSGNYQVNKNDLWIVKPTNLSQGRGIFIFNSLDEIKLEQYVITQYISNISLINGRKYDLRLYVLISSLNPLRIYLYNEGLVRIAIEKYEINMNSLANKYMHITNTDLNIKNKKFISPNNTNDENSNMWNLFMYKRYLKKNNINWIDLRKKIIKIIVKAIISVSEDLLEENQKLNLKAKNFYRILGIDILIKNDFNPLLIEMNYYPEIYFYNNIDKQVKVNLFFDILNIIGIAPFSRKTNNPLYKTIKGDETKYNIDNAFCELSRPRGNFELIFPTKENIDECSKFFKNISFENKEFWKKIIKE